MHGHTRRERERKKEKGKEKVLSPCLKTPNNDLNETLIRPQKRRQIPFQTLINSPF